MKFRVERDVLGDAVAWVARALPSRPVVPVLAGMLIEAGDGLVLSCFDYEVSARIRVDADVAEAGTALVPGRLLAEITRSLPSQPAEFTSSGDEVSLSCGGAEFTLVSLPAGDFPALPEPPPAAGAVDGGVLAAAAGQVVPAASRDDTLPMLTGVCLDFDGDTLTLAATDRYRLAVRELPWAPADPDVRAVALVPARTLADVARTMTAGVPVTIAFGVGGGVGVGVGAVGQAADGAARGGERRGGEPRPAEGMISFEGGGRRLTARLIAGEFIRYRSRFPAEFGCRAEVAAGPFTEAVRRVSLVAERASPVRLAFGPGVVVVEAQAEGRARAVETVAADFEGDEPVISFNPHYLLDGLVAVSAPVPPRAAGASGAGGDSGEAQSESGGRIRIEFTSPAKPALITWAAGSAAGGATGGSSGEAAVSSGGAAGGEAGGGEAGEALGGERGSEDGRTDVAAFRYLVVPLRITARA